MIEVIKKILVIILAVLSIVLSGFILNSNIKKDNPNVVDNSIYNDPECEENQYLNDEGICVLVENTLKIADTKVDPFVGSVATSSDKSSSTSKIITATATTTFKAVANVIVDETAPKIKNVTVSGGGKTMTVSISGINFDKNTNTVILVAGTEISKKMTIPAYTLPSKIQSINFQMTDFRNTYKGTYTFQVETKGKISNIYSLDK